MSAEDTSYYYSPETPDGGGGGYYYSEGGGGAAPVTSEGTYYDEEPSNATAEVSREAAVKQLANRETNKFIQIESEMQCSDPFQVQTERKKLSGSRDKGSMIFAANGGRRLSPF